MSDLFLRESRGRTAIHNEDFMSITITTLNRHDMLNRLIDSIHKHADMPFEIIVSDDGGALYNDYAFVLNLRGRISHLSLNLGRNKGLHCNTNAAVSLSKSKYVCHLYEDVEIKAPFMRKCVELLKTTPYIGQISLDKRPREPLSKIKCLNHAGQEFDIFCQHGSEWASVFRKDYWIEVGGYAEDLLHGDAAFTNTGWLLGYFSCAFPGPSEAIDMDKEKDENDNWKASNSSGQYIDGGYSNYPKIFGIEDSTLRAMDQERILQCGKENAEIRIADYEDSFSPTFVEDLKRVGHHNWARYFDRSVVGGDVCWELLYKHQRFIEQVKEDFVKVIGKSNE
jgi:glycosyltransferase involved in cell wall biosynthesis